MSTESFAISCLLLGVVGALMFVFYLVHSRHMGVKLATWRVLSMTASIFTAVLLYGTLKMLLIVAFEPSPMVSVAIILTVFVTFYVATHGILFLLKDGCTKSTNAWENLEAAGTILAHMSGFAAMYGFADCFELEVVKENGAGGLALLIVASSIFIVVLSSLVEKVMQKVALVDGNADEDEKKWMEQCSETDDDVFCLASSFLVVLFLCYLILGRVMPYMPGKMGEITQYQANILLGCGIGFVLLIKTWTLGFSFLNRQGHRIKDIGLHMINMMMAWTFLFWAEWQLYVWGWESTVIGGALVVAFFLTIASFSVVLLLDAYSRSQARGASRSSNRDVKKTVRSLELALGVLVGFSWERAFDVGFEEIEHTLEHNPKINIPIPHWAGVAIMSFVLLIIVAPAWRLYIMPKAERLEEQEQRDEKLDSARKQVA